MRARLIFIVVAILLLAGFSALNWSEINRSVPLSFGVITAQAPLGSILLGLLVLTLAVFLISSATQEARYLMEHRRHAKALEAQRVLADTAEASRFTDLRQHLDTHLRENRQREAIAATEFEKAMVQSQRELRTELEQMSRALVARLGEIDSRLERFNPPVDVNARPADVPLRDRVKV
jgi:uncharacterized integral membrane protein